MKQKMTLWAISAAAGLIALGAAGASATFYKTLGIGGTELITLRGFSEEAVDTRAEILYSRLNIILSDSNLSATDVQVRKVGADPVIYVKDRLFVTVTPQDAAFNQITQPKQAAAWQERLAKTLPTLNSSGLPPGK